MIPWAESRFSRVISSRRQDLFIVFIRVKALVRALFSVHVVTRKLKKSVTYYFNVRNPPHEKNLKNNAEKVWRLCFITLLLHPHSRENAGTKWWNKLLEKKSSGIIWKFKIKVLIFAATFAKRKRQKSSLIDLHNSTSRTSIGEEILRINTVKRSMTLDYDKRIPERGYDKTI